ncbi:hypothetical protein [Leptolyngbya sp. NIES-2104]|uniref:hypothetical protein n=1 Tax=Leptolyngbya sp. NIES-2104 TaxID=1552121 RepID=UPI0006EC711F|nr:hypothetical protein [Leptolyngbya sp. NIES-2104]GAP95291.1 hypothetical protein NIES2104_18110 [Leptolyngbya sp. NIES-2104]
MGLFDLFIGLSIAYPCSKTKIQILDRLFVRHSWHRRVKRKNMLDETEIEHRLAKIEQEVAALKQKSASTNWLENLIGSISDEEVFLEALKYGREFRDSDQAI